MFCLTQQPTFEGMLLHLWQDYLDGDSKILLTMSITQMRIV